MKRDNFVFLIVIFARVCKDGGQKQCFQAILKQSFSNPIVWQDVSITEHNLIIDLLFSLRGQSARPGPVSLKPVLRETQPPSLFRPAKLKSSGRPFYGCNCISRSSGSHRVQSRWASVTHSYPQNTDPHFQGERNRVGAPLLDKKPGLESFKNDKLAIS